MERHFVTLVLDRSGSMQSQQSDVIEAVNTFKHQLAEETRDGIDIRVTIVLFDYEYNEFCVGVPISEVPDLTTQTYVPRGSTALLDATFRAIKATEAERKKWTKGEARAVIAVMTDGRENASKEVKLEDVKKLLEEKNDDPNWSVAFLGASPETWAEANGMGVVTSNSVKYSGENYGGTMRALGGSVASYFKAGDHDKGLLANNLISANAAAFMDVGSTVDPDALAAFKKTIAEKKTDKLPAKPDAAS